jgi:trimethylamine:corrinoid methyltransferase-like protein
MLGAAKYGIPSASSMGAVNPTGVPITLSGFLAVVWAGHLGHLAITQASRPGIPTILYLPAGSVSLKDGYFQEGPEDRLGQIGRIQMVHELLELPTLLGSSLRGHSKVPSDVQTGLEQGLGCSLGLLGGADSTLIGFSSECGFNAETDVMAGESIRYIKQLMKRINDLDPVPENLAFETLKRAGPKGSLMTDPHTLRNMKLQYDPEFADHRPLNVWLKDKNTMLSRVREKVKEIGQIELPFLSSSIRGRMEKIVEEADQKLKRF